MPDGTHLELTDGWQLWRRAALRAAGMPCDWLEPFATEPTDEAPAGTATAGDDRTGDGAAAQRSAAAVRGFLRHEPAVAAIAWQNPGLIDNWVGGYVAALAAEERPALHRRSQREAKIAKYAQRYCAKNDTIGFFGPVGWATLDDEAPRTEVVGSGKLAGSRSTSRVGARPAGRRWSARRAAAPAPAGAPRPRCTAWTAEPAPAAPATRWS